MRGIQYHWEIKGEKKIPRGKSPKDVPVIISKIYRRALNWGSVGQKSEAALENIKCLWDKNNKFSYEYLFEFWKVSIKSRTYSN